MSQPRTSRPARPLAAALGTALAAGLLAPGVVGAPASAHAGGDSAHAGGYSAHAGGDSAHAGGPAADGTSARRASFGAQLNSWGVDAEFATGRRAGLTTRAGALVVRQGKVRRVFGRRYQQGTWTSPWVSTGFAPTELIPSWEATTSGDALVRIQVRAKGPDGRRGSWDTIADWALDNPRLARSTRSGQSDDLGKVNVDTWQAASSFSAWQVRAVLLRAKGRRGSVRLDRVGAVASSPRTLGATSAPGPGVGTVLDVPTYSQMTHTGHYPQWGGGGEAWCSPTSTAMVLAYYGHVPAPVGVRGDHPDGVVDHTARLTYDHGYGGTGNWAFNTAYAATLAGGDSYVTRLADLRAAEDLVAAGIPVVVSVAFGRGELTGAPISASNGHLMVLVGFDAAGNPVVNDPAGRTNAEVRRTYDRAQFERIWLSASNGTAYVIRNA